MSAGASGEARHNYRTMRKRSEAIKPATTKPLAVARTIPLPIDTSSTSSVICPSCEGHVVIAECTQRDDGRFECSECGSVLDSTAAVVTGTSNARKITQPEIDAAQREIDRVGGAPHNVDLLDGPPEVERMSPPVEMRDGEPPPKGNGGLAGYCSECGAAWPFMNHKPLINCGHQNAHLVAHPSEAKRIAVPGGAQRQDHASPRIRPSAITSATSAAPEPTNRISVPWGSARMPVDQYNNFSCGGFIVTVDLAPGEDRVTATRAIMDDLEKIADEAFERQHAWYLKKLGRMGVPGF